MGGSLEIFTDHLYLDHLLKYDLLISPEFFIYIYGKNIVLSNENLLIAQE